MILLVTLSPGAVGSNEKAAAPSTLDERFKQLAQQREKAKAAGLAIRRAEAADRATQGRYDKLTAKRKGAAGAPEELGHAPAPIDGGAVRGGGSRGRGRGSLGQKVIPVRRKDGAAAVAAGFGLALPKRPGLAARRGGKTGIVVGRGGGRAARGAAAVGRGGGGRGRGAVRGRGRGRGRGAPAPSAEQLNSDLDAYFSEAKKE
ncbi:hypothetical protein KFL_002640130 [Klebsormidium nitens]|uniref:Chromatin target of PRMT1 protein C-terminal domain-containing protein n=1 Tax=Klebsormidium nitens TaxID=105231 RepID=A0A0U9I7P4_KLENI|nr:hypothetical protein KFL_002640130 [Klebsormidium nitens]|eukprot:GAQ85992.1 hypothetical protein KFL_002640130 [Klebsormidium nitens]